MTIAYYKVKINSAEIERSITEEQAWYLRKKYLGIKRTDI